MALPGSPTPKETAETLLAVGVDHYLSGRMRDAASAFQKVLALDPSNEQAQIYLRNMLRPAVADLSAPPPGRGATGWDDGPVINQPPADPRVTGSLRAPMSRPPTPRPAAAPVPTTPKAPTRQQIQTMVREAFAAADLGDFTGAVEKCDRVLEIEPTNAEARGLKARAAATLVQMYESQLGGKAGVPEVIADPGEVIWLNLDSKAGFVLSQIDGQVSYDDLYSICGMSPLDTSRILAKLMEQKVIRTRLGGPKRR